MHISFRPEETGTKQTEFTNHPENKINSRVHGLSGGERTRGIGATVEFGTKTAHGFKGVESGRKNEKKDILESAASFDAKNAHNYMAVMSNTLSDRDFKKLREEGYEPGRMSGAEAVTNLDRIKVVLKEAGVDVAGFTDTVDKDTVTEITGSVSEAARITADTPVNNEMVKDREALGDFVREALDKADLPLTEYNIQEALSAVEMASKTGPLDQGSIEYLLSNSEEPTIENAYVASHSGAGSLSKGAEGYFKTDGADYLAEIAGSEDLKAIEGQIDGIIERAGFKADKKLREDARYLIRQGFALNTDNLRLYEDLKGISFPLKAGDLMQEITEALSEGRGAGSAFLIKGYNRIKNERILNETRLQMNTEANRTIDSDNGFKLDTEELSERVSLLKEKERLYYRAAFSENLGKDGFSTEESISLAEETVFKVSRVKEMPAAVLGSFSSAEAFTINDVYEAGNRLKDRFDAASATYEAVGTEVRADLGDRIGEAFRNIGSLLKDIAFEETADNLRAARILGYNGMEVNAENLNRVKAADQAVRTLVERLTGAVTVSLIKNGVNPLHTGISELNDRISEMEGLSEANTKFSEYLYRLERNNEISEDEAQSYIGIYRLLRQIEKSDGAVTGALVNNGRELTLGNLLTELRTRGRKHLDYNVDDDFGGIISGDDEKKSFRIDTQIETAFRKEPGEEEKDGKDNKNRNSEADYARNSVHEIYDRISPEKLRSLGGISGETTLDELLNAVRGEGETGEYRPDELLYSELAGEYREAANKEEAVYEMLLHYGLDVSADNVNAMDFLMNSRGALFSDMAERISENGRDIIRKHSKKLLDSLGEAGAEETGEAEQEDAAEGVRNAYGEMAEELGSLMEASIERAGRYIDIKALQNLNRCLSLSSSLSREENYEIPMEIDGTLTSVNLKVIRGTGRQGASVSFENEAYGKVFAEFRISDGEVTGYALSSTDEGAARLKSMSEVFIEALKNEGMEANGLIFEKSLNPDINRMPEFADKTYRDSIMSAKSGIDSAEGQTETGKDAAITAALYRTAGLFLKAV